MDEQPEVTIRPDDDDVCILVRCSQPLLDGYVRLPSGGGIHFECLCEWRERGGELRHGR